MTELVKLESRMQELIAEKSMHSYQLKPMDKARRDIVHWCDSMTDRHIYLPG